MELDLTNDEIKHVLKMKKSDLRQMIFDMDYDDFYKYYYTFYNISYNKEKPLFDYHRLIKDAEALGGHVVFPKEIRDKFNKLDKDWKKYHDCYLTISSAMTDKMSQCKHVWVHNGCCGYDRMYDLYKCKLCGQTKQV